MHGLLLAHIFLSSLIYSLDKDLGHQMANYEKVLHKGLKGIKEEVEWYLAQLDQPYMHFGLKEKRDFYKAVLITLDAAMAYARRYADLAREMAAKETNPKRKQELERIAEVCERVPANPARDWWEAVQSVWMIHTLIHCELYNIASQLYSGKRKSKMSVAGKSSLYRLALSAFRKQKTVHSEQ